MSWKYLKNVLEFWNKSWVFYHYVTNVAVIAIGQMVHKWISKEFPSQFKKILRLYINKTFIFIKEIGYKKEREDELDDDRGTEGGRERVYEIVSRCK